MSRRQINPNGGGPCPTLTPPAPFVQRHGEKRKTFEIIYCDGYLCGRHILKEVSVRSGDEETQGVWVKWWIGLSISQHLEAKQHFCGASNVARVISYNCVEFVICFYINQSVNVITRHKYCSVLHQHFFSFCGYFQLVNLTIKWIIFEIFQLLLPHQWY